MIRITAQWHRLEQARKLWLDTRYRIGGREGGILALLYDTAPFLL